VPITESAQTTKLIIIQVCKLIIYGNRWYTTRTWGV
jgi:hypothetical protein